MQYKVSFVLLQKERFWDSLDHIQQFCPERTARTMLSNTIALLSEHQVSSVVLSKGYESCEQQEE